MLKGSNKSKNDILTEENEVNTMLKESKKSAKPLFNKPGLYRTDLRILTFIYANRRKQNVEGK